MRQKLMKTFDDIYILNLHGNAKKKEKAPGGGKDENVFDIQQGVAIGIFVKRPPLTPPLQARGEKSVIARNEVTKQSVIPAKAGIQTSQKIPEAKTGLDARPRGNDAPAGAKGGLKSPLQDFRRNDEHGTVHFAEYFGKRNAKEEYLFSHDIAKTEWKTLSPSTPHYLFIPQDETLRVEYEKGLKINEIFPVNSVGIVTARDSLTIAFTKEELIARVREFLSLEPEQARERLELGKDSSDWKIAWAQKDLKDRKNWENDIVPILYRPFDVRWTVYTGKASGFHVRPRPDVMKHMVGHENYNITFTRSISVGKPFEHVFATNSGMLGRFYPDASCITYFAPIALTSGRLNLGVNLSGRKDDYVYAISYSGHYRRRFIEFLRNDFPRIPFTMDAELYQQLSNLGSQLIDLHLLKSPLLSQTGVNYPVPGGHVVEKGYPKHVECLQMDELDEVDEVDGMDAPPALPAKAGWERDRVSINKDQYFEGVPPEAWAFHIGGYQVLEKWLKDRRGGRLAPMTASTTGRSSKR